MLPTWTPPLTEAQVWKAMSVFPTDVLQYRCWFCGGLGHTLYMCPYLTKDQRLYCAYQNYVFRENADQRRDSNYASRRSVNARNGTRYVETKIPHLVTRCVLALNRIRACSSDGNRVMGVRNEIRHLNVNVNASSRTRSWSSRILTNGRTYVTRNP